MDIEIPNFMTFLSKYGINKTTNFDLKDIADDLGIYVKILMRDELNLSERSEPSYKKQSDAS